MRCEITASVMQLPVTSIGTLTEGRTEESNSRSGMDLSRAVNAAEGQQHRRCTTRPRRRARREIHCRASVISGVTVSRRARRCGSAALPTAFCEQGQKAEGPRTQSLPARVCEEVPAAEAPASSTRPPTARPRRRAPGSDANAICRATPTAAAASSRSAGRLRRTPQLAPSP